jgi:AGZA family xanthine/uracil permease-like MFS transporter
LFVVGGDTTNFVGLGGCKAEGYLHRVSSQAPQLLTGSLSLLDYTADLPYYCAGGVLRSPTTWLGVFVGGIFTVLLMLYRVKGAILIGIFLVSIISWPRPTSVTAFPHTALGDSSFDFFKKVVTFKPLSHIGNAIDVSFPLNCALGKEGSPSFVVQLRVRSSVVCAHYLPLCRHPRHDRHALFDGQVCGPA